MVKQQPSILLQRPREDRAFEGWAVVLGEVP